MNKVITFSILISTMLCSTSIFAKDWYEKSCTLTEKDKAGNWYVGGERGKSHLHIGSGFISVYSQNNKSKLDTNGKENCTVLNQAIADVAGGGYASPADVTACLNAFKTQYTSCK